MVQDIASASTALHQNNVAGEVGVAVLDRTLDTAQVQAQAVTEMIESAGSVAGATAVSDPALGNNVNLLV